MKSDNLINEENLKFAYADDLLILVRTKHQLKRAIKAIKKWADNNGMALNLKKSGIFPI